MSLDRDRTWLACPCGRIHVAAQPGQSALSYCIACGRPASECKPATEAQLDALPNGVTVTAVVWKSGGKKE